MKSLFIFFYFLFQSIGGLANEINLEKHKVRTIKYWLPLVDKPISEKILPASAEMIDYLIQDNTKNNWPNRPKPWYMTSEERNEIIQALNEIPKGILEAINKKLTAIMVVSDLGGSAFTQKVYDERGKIKFGFVILDLNVLKRNANEWATWKEQSPFLDDAKLKLKAQIETNENNNHKNSLQYVLLHEFGHIFSIDEKNIAGWETEYNSKSDIEKFIFTLLSWKFENHQFVNKFGKNKFDSSGLQYYCPEQNKLPAKRMIQIYKQLLNTNFPTLYASTNPSDDFAESFASYIHSVLMKKPWRIDIQKNESLVQIYVLCWGQMRCNEKEKVLERLLRSRSTKDFSH